MTFDSRSAVRDWNLKCGNKPVEIGSPEYWKLLVSQGKCLVEEAKEFLKAAEEKNLLEIVDAQGDVQVVLDGAIFLSQQDHDGAMAAICGNNDLKYTLSMQTAESWVPGIEAAKGVKCQVRPTLFNGEVYYCVVSEHGKIMKPVDHPKVDLTPFVDEPFKKELYVVVQPNCSFCESLVKNLERILDITDFVRLDVMNSQADNDFALENGLTPGSIAYYDGCELKKTSIMAMDFKPSRLGKWLKEVGYGY